MKRQFSKLSKVEQEGIEAEYHQMKPGDFEELMHKAKPHSPEAILLPAQLIETLKTMAELEGEPKYQTMVKRWIEERLQQEAKIALKLSKMPTPKAIASLQRHLTKKSTT